MTNELSAIREVLLRTAPTLSVYRGPSDGSAQVRDLAGSGADPATVDAVEAYLREQPYHAAPHAVFAAGGRVRYAHSLTGGAIGDRIRYGAPADVAPLFGWLQGRPPYVLVVTDRAGADVMAVPGGEVTGETTLVIGPDDEIERNAPGGWSQPRFQRRAEDSWHHNAVAVAQEVTRELHRVDAHLLLVAGDVRAVQMLRDSLRNGVRRSARLQHVPGGRQPDGSQAVRAAAVVEAVESYAAKASADLLGRFIDARGPAGTAVEGARATVAALAAGRVGTLLVADDPADDRTAWFGPDVSARLDAAPGLVRGRLVDVAIRAAVLTDARVHVVSGVESEEIAEGIGALTRFHGRT
jgi:hypothetical protein